MPKPKLTEKQRMFCEEYIIDINATQAAIRAGYSEKTAGETGYENLNKPQIKAYISELKDKRRSKIGITAHSVLENLEKALKIAMGIDDTFVVVKESIGNGMTQTTSQAVKKTDLTNYVKINEMYMKHLGMFAEKVEAEGKNMGNVVIQLVEDKK